MDFAATSIDRSDRESDVLTVKMAAAASSIILF
jgi:hypothetical protein